MLDPFVTILVQIILPIFVLIGVGAAAERAFKLDMRTLSKLNFYIFVPALAFVKLVQSTTSLADMTWIAAFVCAHVIALVLVAEVVCRLFGMGGHRNVMALGASFFNAGNYGLPFAELAFPGVGVGVMAIVLFVQNLLNFTLGLWLVSRGRRGGLATLGGILRVPVVYAVIAAALVRGLKVSVPDVAMVPLNHLAAGLIPIALITLGAQLARTRLGGQVGPLAALAALRLVVSPLLAAGIVWLLPLASDVARVCIAAAGLPVAVNVFILAVEYREDEELASQGIFWTTVLSAVTLTLLLMALRA